LAPAGVCVLLLRHFSRPETDKVQRSRPDPLLKLKMTRLARALMTANHQRVSRHRWRLGGWRSRRDVASRKRVASLPVVTVKAVLLSLAVCFALTGRSFADDALNNGQDFTRPPAQYDLRYQFEEKDGDVWQDLFILRVNRPFTLGDGWEIGTRLDLPFALTNKSSGDNPSGATTFGFGDLLLQAALIDECSNRLATGLGPRLVLPTASQEQFGSGRIQLGPIGGVRYSLPEISEGSFVQLVVRYDRDIGGQPGRGHINRIQWSPTFNMNLPQKWYITLFPSQDLAVNFSDGGKWFFPLDLLIGKHLSDRTLVSLEVSVPLIKEYELYEFKLQARFSLTF
jgi:hypothetical protein